MSLKKFGALVGISLILAGCATSPVMHGETRAVGAVKADAVRQITQWAKVVARCDAVDAIQSKVVKINPVGSGGTEASQQYGSVEEHWVAYLCGQKSPYLVILTPDGQGGTFVSTKFDLAALGVPSGKPFYVTGEQLEHQIPLGWKLAWMEGIGDGSYFVEYIPQEEEIEKWREGYLLIQRMPYPSADVLAQVARAKSRVADVALMQFINKAARACAGWHQAMEQQVNVLSGVNFAVGGGFCERYGSAAPFGEGSAIAFVEGKDFLFQVQYGWRPKTAQAQDDALPWRINPQVAKEHLEAIKASTLCGGVSQPCLQGELFALVAWLIQ